MVKINKFLERKKLNISLQIRFIICFGALKNRLNVTVLVSTNSIILYLDREMSDAEL